MEKSNSSSFFMIPKKMSMGLGCNLQMTLPFSTGLNSTMALADFTATGSMSEPTNPSRIRGGR